MTNLDALSNLDEQESLLMTEAEYFRSIGRLEAQVAALTAAITELKSKFDGIDARLDQLDRLANRWKGGFAVILVLGGIAGFVLDNILRLFVPKGG
ncbi:MAG: hypothetical protein WC464_03765 [Bdellovibrionales bacterium]